MIGASSPYALTWLNARQRKLRQFYGQPLNGSRSNSCPRVKQKQIRLTSIYMNYTPGHIKSASEAALTTHNTTKHILRAPIQYRTCRCRIQAACTWASPSHVAGCAHVNAGDRHIHCYESTSSRLTFAFYSESPSSCSYIRTLA